MLTDHRKVVARLAWFLLYLLCVGLAVGTLQLGFLNGVDLVEFVVESNAAVAVLIVSFSVIGALIAAHRSGSSIGWVFFCAAFF
jgi:hypothetical protein